MEGSIQQSFSSSFSDTHVCSHSIYIFIIHFFPTLLLSPSTTTTPKKNHSLTPSFFNVFPSCLHLIYSILSYPTQPLTVFRGLQVVCASHVINLQVNNNQEGKRERELKGKRRRREETEKGNGMDNGKKQQQNDQTNEEGGREEGRKKGKEKNWNQ